MESLAVQWENKTYTCIERVKDVESGGYLYGDDPLKHTFPVFIALVALAQIVSHVFYFLLRPLKQPKFVCNLLVSFCTWTASALVLSDSVFISFSQARYSAQD